ncbi:MAG: glycogen debranching enzyme family protein [Acidobacteria bacterium]|nr:glycogen debranching enzyme family protein [Acidobacteriota bacterium]
MAPPLRRMPWPGASAEESEQLLASEWLVANGLGGYASGTISGVITRRYHGLLVAALPAPAGRTMMLNEVWEHLVLPDGRTAQLGGEERRPHSRNLVGAGYLTEFRLEWGLPVWTYTVDGVVIEKRVIMPHRQNTVLISYRLLSGARSLELELYPAFHFRFHEAPVDAPVRENYALTIMGGRYEVSAGEGLPPVRILLYGERGSLTVDRRRIGEIRYHMEASRGYPSTGEMWSPGYFTLELRPDREASLVASAERWARVAALSPSEALGFELQRRRHLLARAAHPALREGTGAELVLAADQFLTTPAGRLADSVRARAAGHEIKTVIAGYHWFTDWGRDTMISLEGLTLTTGRREDAASILRSFAYYVRDGLIPNMFPEGQTEGLYHTADASLWFFHALQQFVEATDDRLTLRALLPTLRDIVECHVAGTRFGIHVDHADGLLAQGAEGYQLTWMDAKVDNWVVTPRRGKAIEINALWYNALRLMQGWLAEEGDADGARGMQELADLCRASFNRRFWFERGGYLYDVVDGESGDDSSLRPNQLLAVSLDHPVLDSERWEAVLEIVRGHLLTPVGLRSLDRGHPDYKPRYDGDLRARDAAYHQGTVWAWLIGPFVDAWLKVHPGDRAGARGFLDGLVPELGRACIGSISEIFDAEPPFTPRGCIAQAWSVAEMVRCWALTADAPNDRHEHGKHLDGAS